MGSETRIAAVLTAAVAAMMCSGQVAGAGAAAGTWGTAIEVPGTAALNADGAAAATSVSCGSAGNCSAGGYYTNGSGGQPFVVSQVGGKWGRAIQVPGIAILNVGRHSATVSSVSCSSAGNCSVGGDYTDSSFNYQAFVDSQVRGKWGRAIEVPGTATLNAGGSATITSMSCASAGNCTAAGGYTDGSGRSEVLVVSQVNGKWGRAIEMPGTATLNKRYATVWSVSCASAGNCTAAGQYTDGSGRIQAFVDSQVSGKWRTAIEVPGTATLNARGKATANSVSCASAGNCTAAGYYTDRSGHSQAFVDSQIREKWGTAIEVRGTAGLNKAGNAGINSVSCASAGNCTVAGYYTDRSGHGQAFVDSQVRGKWGTAIEVPGTAALNAGGSAFVTSVSCRSAGNCAAGGSYYDRSGHGQAFVDSQVSGKWGTAIEVPGTAILNVGGGAGVKSVSCGTTGKCSVAGYYTDRSGRGQAWVDSQS